VTKTKTTKTATRKALRRAAGDREALVSILRAAYPMLSVQEGHRDEPIEVWDVDTMIVPTASVDVATGKLS
jgi:hypothetical protein